MKAGNATTAELEKQYGLSARAIEYFGRKTEEVDSKQQAFTASAKQHAEAVANLRVRMFGGDAISAAQDYMDALGPVVNLHKLSKEETERLHKALGDALDAYQRLGKTAPQVMNDVYAATTDGSAAAIKAMEAEGKAVLKVGELYKQLGRTQLERTGTTTQKMVDDVNRWYEAEKGKIDLTTGAHTEHLAVLKTMYDEKMSGIMVNYDQLRGKSKAFAEDEARRAEATLAYLVKQVGTVNEVAAADLEAARASAVAARERVTGWNETADAAVEAGDAAEDASRKAAEGAKQASTEVRALAASYTVVTASAEQWRAQAARLNADAARTEMAGGTSLTGWQFQYVENLRTSAANASRSAGYQQSIDAQMAGGRVPWGNTTAGAFNINVNAMQGIDGDQIAQALVDGMRRRGVSPGA